MPKALPVERINHSLDLEEKLDAHIRGWRWQRAGWLVMLLVVLSALLGLCGNGPLSYRTVAVNNDTLSYEYFLRYEGQTLFSVNLQQQNGLSSIAFPARYWESFQVENIIPEPAETRQVADSFYYFFRGDGKGIIRFFLKPEKRGRIEGGISINQRPVSLSHFIYP